jgi:hypothetical protein
MLSDKSSLWIAALAATLRELKNEACKVCVKIRF